MATATAIEMNPPDATMVSTLNEDLRCIGVIRVPPPKERRRKIDRNSRYQLEPWMSKLRLVTELPRHPLRGRPHRSEHDRKDDDDLLPENFGRGHDDQESSVACAKSKCGISSGVPTATAGYDSLGRGTAVEGLLSENPENICSLRVFRILTTPDTGALPGNAGSTECLRCPVT